MTTEAMHQPPREFRDYLEGEITREFRSHRSFARLRVTAILLGTLAAGTTAGLASAQIRQGAQRDSLLETANSELYVAALRLELARSLAAEAASKHKVGAAGLDKVAQAEAELRKVEAIAARAKLNVDEIKASALPPRDDLNAPLVGTRDFVTERLQLDLFVAQQRLTSAEQGAGEVERQVRAGAVDQSALLESMLEVTRARAALGTLAERRKLRKEFIDRGTSGDELNRMFEQARLRHDAMVAQESVNLLRQRLGAVQKQHAVGAATELDLLRAQVELKEKEVELHLLARQLRDLKGRGQ